MATILTFLFSFWYKICKKIQPEAMRRPLISTQKKYVNLCHLGFCSKCSLGGSGRWILVRSQSISLRGWSVWLTTSSIHSKLCNETYIYNMGFHFSLLVGLGGFLWDLFLRLEMCRSIGLLTYNIAFKLIAQRILGGLGVKIYKV